MGSGFPLPVGVLGLLEQRPVIDVIVDEPFAHEEVPEELAAVCVVRLLLKAQRAAVAARPNNAVCCQYATMTVKVLP